MRALLCLSGVVSCLLLACSSASPRYIGEHAPSPYDCGYGHVCERGEYCELDIPIDHDACSPNGSCSHGHPSSYRCRALPATCPRPLTCDCLRAAHAPMSSCRTERLLGGRSSVEVSLERDLRGAIVPLSCDELRCDPAAAYCSQGESARCLPLPTACQATPSCHTCFQDNRCRQVGDQLRVDEPPPA